jgi:hypothetical protein
MQQPEMIPLKGNTYPIRGQLSELGGRYDKGRQVWLIPSDRISEARALLSEEEKKPSPGKPASVPKAAKRSPASAEEPDPSALDAILRGACVHLQNLVTYEGRWDDKTEDRIRNLAGRVKDAGGDSSWAEDAIERFKKTLKSRQSGRGLY